MRLDLAEPDLRAVLVVQIAALVDAGADLRYVKPLQPILMPSPPSPPGWNGGGGSPRSPYMPSPRLGNPELRVQTSRDTLDVGSAGPSTSRETLGRTVSFRSSDLARTRSGRLAP